MPRIQTHFHKLSKHYITAHIYFVDCRDLETYWGKPQQEQNIKIYRITLVERGEKYTPYFGNKSTCTLNYQVKLNNSQKRHVKVITYQYHNVIILFEFSYSYIFSYFDITYKTTSVSILSGCLGKGVYHILKMSYFTIKITYKKRQQGIRRDKEISPLHHYDDETKTSQTHKFHFDSEDYSYFIQYIFSVVY